MASRIDARRTALAALAAILAALGALAANADDGMAIWFVAAWMFAGEAVVGGLFALVPSRGRWSQRRRTGAGLVAVICTFVAPILIFVRMARAACGCGNAANGYMLPTLLGVVAHDLVVVASIAFPVLMAATTAAALDRIRLPRRPSSA
jgi:hypothetical protein